MTLIETVESIHGRTIARSRKSPLAWVVGKYAADQTMMPWPAIHSGETVDVLEARVNHGRWMVDCPDCPVGAVLASMTDPRFVCVVCGSGPHAVVFPDDQERIESALVHRPKENRNWSPGEDVEMEEVLSAGWLLVGGAMRAAGVL